MMPAKGLSGDFSGFQENSSNISVTQVVSDVVMDRISTNVKK